MAPHVSPDFLFLYKSIILCVNGGMLHRVSGMDHVYILFVAALADHFITFLKYFNCQRILKLCIVPTIAQYR